MGCDTVMLTSIHDLVEQLTHVDLNEASQDKCKSSSVIIEGKG